MVALRICGDLGVLVELTIRRGVWVADVVQPARDDLRARAKFGDGRKTASVTGKRRLTFCHALPSLDGDIDEARLSLESTGYSADLLRRENCRA
jgi:hypothetical protein